MVQVLKIYSPDDSYNYSTTTIDVAGENMTWDNGDSWHRHWGRGRNNEIQPSHYRQANDCLLYTSPSPRDGLLSRMPSSA